MRFGERLKDILESKGMNQAELSRLSGIDEGYISKIITDKAAAGRRTPTDYASQAPQGSLFI